MIVSKKIFITGGSGFVGSALLNRLSQQLNTTILAHSRRFYEDFAASVVQVVSSSFSALPDPMPLRGVQVVIHSAARVHIMDDKASDPLSEFRSVNVRDTLSLARQAAKSGVRRFIFISSIKVNGEGREPGNPYTADDAPAPADPYGISKNEAEQGLRELAQTTGMEVTIIRPVLVYGPRVKANFYSMMSWLNRGIPLPFGAIHNKRSLVALDNLVDLITTCIDHPAAANQTFLVSDGEDLSTTELLQRMGQALGKPARLIPVSEKMIWLGAKLFGKQHIAQRLCGSLQVDMQKTFDLLGWRPPVSVDQALYDTAQYYLKHQSR